MNRNEQKSAQRFKEVPLSKSKKRDGGGTTFLFPIFSIAAAAFWPWGKSAKKKTKQGEAVSREITLTLLFSSTTTYLQTFCYITKLHPCFVIFLLCKVKHIHNCYTNNKASLGWERRFSYNVGLLPLYVSLFMQNHCWELPCLISETVTPRG